MASTELAPPPEEEAGTDAVVAKTTTDDENAKDDKEATSTGPLATAGEVFSFAQTTQVKVYIVCGLACAVVSGLVFPCKWAINY